LLTDIDGASKVVFCQNPDACLTSEEKLQEPLRKEEITIFRKKVDHGFGQENPVQKVKIQIEV